MKHNKLTKKDVEEAQVLIEHYCLPIMQWKVCLSADEEYLYLRLNDEEFYRDSANTDCYDPLSAAAHFTILIEELYQSTNLDI